MTNESNTDCYPGLKVAISKIEDQKREIERLDLQATDNLSLCIGYRAEIDTLRAQWQQLNDQYMALKGEIAEAEGLQDRYNLALDEINRLRDMIKDMGRDGRSIATLAEEALAPEKDMSGTSTHT